MLSIMLIKETGQIWEVTPEEINISKISCVGFLGEAVTLKVQIKISDGSIPQA